MKHPLICGLGALALLLALYLGCATVDAASASRSAAASASAPATAHAAVRRKTDQIRGFSVQLCDPDPRAVQQDLAAIDELADMGCTWLNFVVSARQDNVRSTSISVMWENALPPKSDILRIMHKAKSRGMGVMLMPIVLLTNSGPKDWRGVIEPTKTRDKDHDKGKSDEDLKREAWDDWFASYNHYITDMAQLAQDGNADVFCVGSELLSTEKFRPRWVAVIGEIRQRFHGKLTYSANWDHYEVPTFWDQVDYIGMNNYNELNGEKIEDIDAYWATKIKPPILDFVRRQNKPFMFTEVGWHNLKNTLKEPWNYVATGEIDHDQQRLAFQSFVDTWGNVPNSQFMGAFIWEWRPGTQPNEHGTYSLQGTEALDIVRKWMQTP